MKAGGLKRQLEQFGTLFGLKLSHLVFTLTEQLSCTLQAKNTTVQAAISAAYQTESWLKWQRTDEKFDSFYADVLFTSEGLTKALTPTRKRRMPWACRRDVLCDIAALQAVLSKQVVSWSQATACH